MGNPNQNQIRTNLPNQNQNQNQQNQNANQSTQPAEEQVQVIQPTEPSPLDKAIKFLGQNLRSVREWPASNGRTNAQVSLNLAVKVPAPHKTIADVARKIIDDVKAIRDNTGMNTYAQFKLRYANKTAQARLISVADDDKSVTMSLEIEHNISGSSSAGVVSFTPRQAQPENADGTNSKSDEAVPDLGGF